jgi:hydroxymethylpyrimidine/phosphomethylpyrimidine kinase
MPLALTIAGSDSGGGAGIQADLKTFAAHGVYGTSAITAVTAQNTLGVTAIHALPADMVTAQIEAIVADLPPDAVKIGMLATPAIVEATAAAVEALELPFVVLDPVMVAKSGHRLLDEDAAAALIAELIPKAYLITPNVPEAEVLADMSIRTVDDAREAAQRILALGPTAVVVKGGHLAGDDVVDVLFDGHRLDELRGPRVPGRSTHGTGCTFSSAIAANLARGASLQDAVSRARAYVAAAIASAPGLGGGHGPLGHFLRAKPPAFDAARLAVPEGAAAKAIIEEPR